jgi:hypothetical protein
MQSLGHRPHHDPKLGGRSVFLAVDARVR